MEYRRLGSSGLQVSLLSFGSWLTFGKQIGDTTAEDLMQYAYDQGVNFFDNAEIYAQGESERVMGSILQKMQWDRTSYLISSKVFFGDGRNKPNQTGLSRKHIVEACNDALRRLQTDYLDLFFCHRADRNTPIAETVWSMNLLIQQGKILYWGTSEWNAQEITEAHAVAERYNLIGPTMEQPQYNMFHRQRVEVEYSHLYKQYGLGTTIWSPLASGVLTGKYNDGLPEEKTRLTSDGLEWLRNRSLADENLAKTRKLTALAADLGVKLPQLAIAWCIKNPHVSTAILGASKIEQLKETIRSIDVVQRLTPEVMQHIEDVLQNKPELPPFGR